MLLYVTQGESPEWTKHQWRKKVIKRRRSDAPEESISFEVPENGDHEKV